MKPRIRNNGRGAARVARGGLSPEFLYLTENARDLEGFAGEVLLIHGSRLVAHSPHMSEILKAVEAEGIRSPFIFRVPQETEKVFL